LPYAQYWVWLLCGVACSEVSSLGCHTHLWNPAAARYSSLAVSRGWASLFAPLRPAWDVLGTLGAQRAAAWGLPAGCQVHVGVHDSNACLARYLAARDGEEALTLVSSGTWTVLMAPGAPAHALVAAQDMLGNVDITGRMTPTARFMGGREFAALLDGAKPAAATERSVQAVLDSATLAVPAFSPQGGPFAGHAGVVLRGAQVLAGPLSQHLDEAARAALAALYCAQMTAWLVRYLWCDHARGRVLVEGPLAGNPVYLQMLQALLPHCRCLASSDTVEGTARGAWMLTRWQDRAPGTHLQLRQTQALSLAGVAAYQQRWLAAVQSLPQHIAPA
jgi:sugar (pentulose or hexulose) kinase